MIKDPLTVDLISTIPFIIQTRFNDTYLSHATGFIYKSKDKNYLITNWHVMSGRHAQTKQPLHEHLATPNNLTIYPSIREGKFCQRISSGIRIDLFNEERDSFLWLEHPEFSNEIDVAAIELENTHSGVLVNINQVLITISIMKHT